MKKIVGLSFLFALLVFSGSFVSAGELEGCQFGTFDLERHIYNSSMSGVRDNYYGYHYFHNYGAEEYSFVFYYYPNGTYQDLVNVCGNPGTYYGTYDCFSGSAMKSGKFDLSASCGAYGANYSMPVTFMEDARELSEISIAVPAGRWGWCEFDFDSVGNPYDPTYGLIVAGFKINTFTTHEEISNPTLQSIADASYELVDINLSLWRILFLVFEILVLIAVCVVLPITMLMWLRENLERLLQKRG